MSSPLRRPMEQTLISTQAASTQLMNRGAECARFRIAAKCEGGINDPY